MPRRAKTERKHQKINQTQKKNNPMYVFVFPAPFSTVFHWVMQVFSFGYFGILHVCQEMQKTWRKQKKQYQPYVPMGPVVLFCLFFVFSTFFFCFFCTVAKKNQIQRKYQKTKLSKTPMGLIFFCGLVRVRNF